MKEGFRLSARILIVEDEKPIADILKFNLEREGYQVQCIYDGMEAIETAINTSSRSDAIGSHVAWCRWN